MRLRKRFLMILLKEKSITRKKLVENLGISVSTLSYLVEKMRMMGLIGSRKVAHGRGRPYEIVELKENAWFGLSMKVGRESVKVVLFNAHMKAVEEREIKITKQYRNNLGYEKIMIDLFKPFKEHEKLRCIGVSASGVVENGVITHSPIMNVNDFDIQSIVLSIFPNVHLSILNDVEALVNFEKHMFGGNDLLVVNYGMGIGAAFLKKSQRRFFELGHTIVKLDGEECYCGQKGCLETVASEYAALKRFMNRNFSIFDFVEYEEEKYRTFLDELRRLSVEKPNEALKFFKEPLKMLSKELSNVIIILKPNRISFYGEGIKKWMVEEIKRNVKNILLKFRMDHVELVCRENVPYSWEIGVLFDSLEKYFNTI